MLIDELDFHFDVIGISETKITNSNEDNAKPSIPGYVFEHVSTPLASGDAGLFVEKLLKYNVLEKKLHMRQSKSLWVEISFVDDKNIICGMICPQADHSMCSWFNIEKV